MSTREPLIRIREIAYGRVQAPDLDAMEAFLVEFGMLRSARTATTLYMRGTGSNHHFHVTERGEPGFVSVAYEARDEADLATLTTLPGATGIEHIDEPGGGRRVRIIEPVNGYQLEVVQGIEHVAEIPASPRPLRWAPEVLATVGAPERLQFGPSRVKRLSHAVFATPRLPETLRWFRETLGVITTDEFYVGKPDNVVGSFNRLDRGDDPVDHHVLNCYLSERTGMQHLSYEVDGIDELFIGHNHLKRLGRYEHMRGVGYHPPGGQIYDYWLSPWEHMVEHYLPTQRFTSRSAVNLMPAPDAHDPSSKFANTLARQYPWPAADRRTAVPA